MQVTINAGVLREDVSIRVDDDGTTVPGIEIRQGAGTAVEQADGTWLGGMLLLDAAQANALIELLDIAQQSQPGQIDYTPSSILASEIGVGRETRSEIVLTQVVGVRRDDVRLATGPASVLRWLLVAAVASIADATAGAALRA
jgi:hypothetical protein